MAVDLQFGAMYLTILAKNLVLLHPHSELYFSIIQYSVLDMIHNAHGHTHQVFFCSQALSPTFSQTAFVPTGKIVPRHKFEAVSESLFSTQTVKMHISCNNDACKNSKIGDRF